MLRHATKADLQFVHGLYQHETISPFIAYDPMPLKEFGPIYWDLLSAVDLRIFEVDGVTAGMAQIQWVDHRFVHSVHLG